MDILFYTEVILLGIFLICAVTLNNTRKLMDSQKSIMDLVNNKQAK
jgi:hypothetical protein